MVLFNTTADMSVMWTPLRLVMAENERKEAETSHVEASIIRGEKRVATISKSFASNSLKEEGSGDYNAMKDLQTLPLRTDFLRAKFQEKINAENRLITTALVERPKYQNNKDDFNHRRQHEEERAVDCPDDAGVPDRNGFGNHRNYIGADSKERPLVVNLPDQNKNTESDINEMTPNIENITQNNMYTVKEKELEMASESTNRSEEDCEKDNDCIVNCIYYTQQFCDCTIL